MTNQSAGRAFGESQRTYAELHFDEGVAEAYEANYHPSSYDTIIWGLQRRLLRDLLRSVRARIGHLKYLDFACGTGRIISGVEDVATDATGTDISPLMLSVAERRTRSSLRCGDVLTSPTLVDRDYDAITAFRFFLNTDAVTRLPLLRDLAQRLRDGESRLIFNIHGNRNSALVVTDGYRRLRGWPPLRTLSSADVLSLTTGAGLEIVSVHGYGLVPRRMYRTFLAGLARVIDATACRIGALALISQDVVYVCRLLPRRSSRDRP